MTQDQMARLAYLGILGIAIAGSLLVSGRNNWGKMTQQAAIWLFIFLGVIAAYGLWDDISRDVTQQQNVLTDGRIEIPRSLDGHYYVTLNVNDTPLRFVIDTGASQVVLTREDAARVGIDVANLSYWGSATTANGQVSTAPVFLDSITLGSVTDDNVPAVVNGAQMDISLLGMTYLDRFGHISISNNQMVLSR